MNLIRDIIGDDDPAIVKRWLVKQVELQCMKCENYREDKPDRHGAPTGEPGCVVWYCLPGQSFGQSNVPFSNMFKFGLDQCSDWKERVEVG